MQCRDHTNDGGHKKTRQTTWVERSNLASSIIDCCEIFHAKSRALPSTTCVFGLGIDEARTNLWQNYQAEISPTNPWQPSPTPDKLASVLLTDLDRNDNERDKLDNYLRAIGRQELEVGREEKHLISSLKEHAYARRRRCDQFEEKECIFQTTGHLVSQCFTAASVLNIYWPHLSSTWIFRGIWRRKGWRTHRMMSSSKSFSTRSTKIWRATSRPG